jgi:hypothetical protein
LNDSVLSYNEHHKHLHFNVYNGSQLNISWVCLKTIFSLHYSLSGNTSITTVITLQGLLVNNHLDLITEKGKSSQRSPKQGLVSICFTEGRGTEEFILFCFLRIFKSFALGLASMIK